jgi:hypothetical protein
MITLLIFAGHLQKSLLHDLREIPLLVQLHIEVVCNVLSLIEGHQQDIINHIPVQAEKSFSLFEGSVKTSFFLHFNPCSNGKALKGLVKHLW